jgi:hypothetical protein
MPYSQGAVRHRGDIASVVMEADDWDNQLIFRKVLPVVTSQDETGEYPKFTLLSGGLLKRDVPLNRAPGAASARGSLAYTWDTFATQEFSYEIPVDRAERMKVQDYFDAQAIAARMAKRKIHLERELIAASTTFSTSNYGSATNSATAYTLANIATFDIGLDIDAAKSRLRGKGESDRNVTVVMSDDVFVRARASTKMQNRLRGLGVSSDTILNVDAAAVAEALGVKEILVGKAYYDTAGEGKAASTSSIWGNTYVWVGNLASGGGLNSMLSGGAQYCITWSRFASDISTFEYEEPQTKSLITGVEEYRTEKVVNANAGTLIATQYS